VIGKDGTGTAVVSVVNNTHSAIRNVTTRLDLPAGWIATPIGSANVGTLPPAGFAHVEFSIKSASTSAPGDVVNETGTAIWNGQHVIQADQSQQIEFDPNAFPVVGVDDHFTSDTSADYSTDQPNPCCEVAPTLTFGNGLLKASGTPAYYTQVVHKSGPQSDRAVVVVSPQDWANQSPAQNALFIGLVKDAKNYVTAWTGPVLGEGSGLDVMVDGTLHGYCCWSLPTAITPGTQWAIAINGNTITTWVNSGSGWIRVVTQDVSDSIDLTKPGVIEQYHFAVGFRAQNGDQSISSLTGRSFPGG
jgi:alpha-galactosidase-like protein